jgi:hypothetical protein
VGGIEWIKTKMSINIYEYICTVETVTEPRKTEPRKTERRKTEHRKGLNIERPNIEWDRTSKD